LDTAQGRSKEADCSTPKTRQAALIAAYPERGSPVQDWLDARPDGPPAGPKEFGWSHMAGWYAERGCQAFYSALWTDARVTQELEGRLRTAKLWMVAEELAR